MIRITFKGREFDVIDETPTHYICPPASNMEGYHYISKSESEVVEPMVQKQIREIGDEFNKAIEYWTDGNVLNPHISMCFRGHHKHLDMSDNDVKLALIAFIQKVAKIAESKYI